MNPAPLLSFDKVALVTGGVRLFDDISFAVGPGAQVAICGDSGEGKSMLARLALGLTRPLSGKVELFGADVETLDIEALRKQRWRCGLSLQGGSLIGDLDVEDNLMLGIDIAGDARRRIGRKLDRIMLEFQIDHLGNAKVHSLSAGERQRVELARAFLRDPELVILDEPLVGARAQADQIERQIRRQVHQRGRALLLLTQDRPLAERLCETVFRIERNRLVQHEAAGAEPVAIA